MTCFRRLVLLALAVMSSLPRQAYSLAHPSRADEMTLGNASRVDKPPREASYSGGDLLDSPRRDEMLVNKKMARGNEKKSKDTITSSMKEEMKISEKNGKTTVTKSSKKGFKITNEENGTDQKEHKEAKERSKGGRKKSKGSDSAMEKKERTEQAPKSKDVKICEEKYLEGKKGWRQKIENEMQEYIEGCVKQTISHAAASSPPSVRPSSSSFPSTPTEAPAFEPSSTPILSGAPTSSSPPTFDEPSTSDKPSGEIQEPTAFSGTISVSPSTVSSVPTSSNVAVAASRTEGGTLAPTISPTLQHSQNSDSPNTQPSFATISPTEYERETIYPTNNKRAVTVSASLFAVSYEIPESDPTTEEYMQAESVTLQFLSQFLEDTFESMNAVDFEVLYGFAIAREKNPIRVSYEATVGLRGTTDFTPTTSDLDMLIKIAFDGPSSEALLQQLSALPSTNPFSRSSSVISAFDSTLSTARQGEGTTMSTGVLIGGLAGLIVLLMGMGAAIMVKKRSREGRCRPKDNERHELMPGGSYDESLYTAPANVLTFPFEGPDKRSLTDSELSYEAEMRRAHGSSSP